MANQPKAIQIATMSRSVYYDDGSGPRCEVSFDSLLRLGKEPDRYVRVKAVGSEDILINLRDAPFVIEALGEALRLNELTAA